MRYVQILAHESIGDVASTVGTIGAPSDNGRIVVSTGSLTPAQAVAKYVQDMTQPCLIRPYTIQEDETPAFRH